MILHPPFKVVVRFLALDAQWRIVHSTDTLKAGYRVAIDKYSTFVCWTNIAYINQGPELVSYEIYTYGLESVQEKT